MMEQTMKNSDQKAELDKMLDDGVIRVDGEVKVSGVYQLASEPKTNYDMVWLAFNGLHSRPFVA